MSAIIPINKFSLARWTAVAAAISVHCDEVLKREAESSTIDLPPAPTAVFASAENLLKTLEQDISLADPRQEDVIRGLIGSKPGRRAHTRKELKDILEKHRNCLQVLQAGRASSVQEVEALRNLFQAVEQQGEAERMDEFAKRESPFHLTDDD